MSGVLHPVGPEPAKTYWVRRAVVFGAIVVVLVIVIALVVNATGRKTATPAPLTATPTALPTPTPTTSVTPKPKPQPGSSKSAQPEVDPTVRPVTPTVAVTRNPGPIGCAPTQLRVTLTGKQKVEVKKPNTFKLSVINGSKEICIVAVTKDNFELKISSGNDRIWRSTDCSTALKAIETKVAPQMVVEWDMAWNGRRSKPDCKNRPEIPRAGTYFATATLDGAEPVRMRMLVVN